jgi:hypothetical protein
MTALEKISFFLNQRNEIPNQKLARTLAAARDRKGIREIADNLWHANQNVRSDCLKVLYEIGYIDPSLIAGYSDKFLRLLNDKENRMIWGAMIALATVAPLCPHEIWTNIDDVIRTVNGGTLITVVWGIKALASVASSDPRYEKKIFPVLLGTLRTCIPRDIPTHAESIVRALRQDNRKDFLALLERRGKELTTSQASRLKRILKKMDLGEMTAQTGSPKRKNIRPAKAGRARTAGATAKRRVRKKGA